MEEENFTDLKLEEIPMTESEKCTPPKKNKLKEFRKGRWLLSEHFRYLYASLTYGSDYFKIQKYVKTRSVQQIRSHSQKYLSKLRLIIEKNCPQTKEEYRSKPLIKKYQIM